MKFSKREIQVFAVILKEYEEERTNELPVDFLNLAIAEELDNGNKNEKSKRDTEIKDLAIKRHDRLYFDKERNRLILKQDLRSEKAFRGDGNNDWNEAKELADTEPAKRKRNNEA